MFDTIAEHQWYGQGNQKASYQLNQGIQFINRGGTHNSMYEDLVSRTVAQLLIS